MSPIRIHLGHMPAMLRTIIDDLLAEEPDLVVVGASRNGDDPLLRARAEQADMVITEASHGGKTCLDAIMSGPPLSVFAIAPDGMDAAAVTLVRRPIEFDAANRASFADAIRRVAGRP